MPFHTGSDKIQSNQRRLKRITGNKQNLVSKYWKVMKNPENYLETEILENTENTKTHWKNSDKISLIRGGWKESPEINKT